MRFEVAVEKGGERGQPIIRPFAFQRETFVATTQRHAAVTRVEHGRAAPSEPLDVRVVRLGS